MFGLNALTGQMLTMGAGVAMQGWGFFQQAKQADAAGDYNYETAMNNAAMVEEEVKIAVAKARFDRGEIDRQTSMLQGRQVATMAASGLAIEVGTSTGDVLEDTAKQAAIDKGLIMADLKINKWRMREQKRNIVAGGEMDRWYAGRKESAAYTDLAGSLLSGASNMWDRWQRGKRVGVDD